MIPGSIPGSSDSSPPKTQNPNYFSKADFFGNSEILKCFYGFGSADILWNLEILIVQDSEFPGSWEHLDPDLFWDLAILGIVDRTS